MGLCTDSSPKRHCTLARLSVCCMRCPGLAARLTEHIQCLYLPGIQDANKPRYRLLRRKLWGAAVAAQRCRRGQLWESIRGCSVAKAGCRAKPIHFPGALGLDIPFSPLYTAQIGEEHECGGSQGPLYLFDPCRLGLFLACCAKASNRSNFLWIRLSRWPRWEIPSHLYRACKLVSEILKLPSRQCSAFPCS